MGLHFTVDLDQFDYKGNGVVDIVEFRMAVREQARSRQEVLHDLVMKSGDEFTQILDRMWKRTDVDGNNQLDKNEVRALATELAGRMGKTPPVPEAVDELIKKYDKNGNGVIDRDEFAALVEELFLEV